MFQLQLGDCAELLFSLEEGSVDVVVTSPPYWGQRTSLGNGVEDDPRAYIKRMAEIFSVLLTRLANDGVVWINLGDAYNTPINWRFDDYRFSTLGHDRNGLSKENSAYVKPRAARKAYIDKQDPWMKYGMLLDLPHRFVEALVEAGYYYRGEVIWHKKNAMPEGRCRRPHRKHESILLFSRSERHRFRISPPVESVWSFASEKVQGERHFSRFPLELPRRCIEASDPTAGQTVVCDPFSGSGTTGMAALHLGCHYVGFEIDPSHYKASLKRLTSIAIGNVPNALSHEGSPSLHNEL